MKTHRGLGLIILWLIGSSLCAQKSVDVRIGPYTGPKSLGSYTHEHDVAIGPFLASLGTLPSGKTTYCFANKPDGLYLHASVDDEHDRGRVERVFLSSFPNCLHMTIISADLPPDVWRTPEGIHIGSTKAEVLRAYHEPSWKTSGTPKLSVNEIAGLRGTDRKLATPDDERFGYACFAAGDKVCDDLRFFEVGFAKGRVVWLLISDSE